MANSKTILKLKEAMLTLIRTVPCDKVTVQLLLDQSGVSRPTFYKYFPNMEVFYHICGNDLVRSIAYQSHTLILTTSNRPYRLEKSRIEALATADAPLIGSAIADLLLEQQSLLRCLVLEQMDPQFLEKWLSLEKAALTELFRTHRHSESRSRDMAEVFSISLVNGYLHGALENDRKAILRTHHTTTEIIRQLIK